VARVLEKQRMLVPAQLNVLLLDLAAVVVEQCLQVEMRLLHVPIQVLQEV
jgi:hypothetical protein